MSLAPWCFGMTSWQRKKALASCAISQYQLEGGIANSVSLAERSNVKESQGLIALEELEAGDLSCASGQSVASWSLKATEQLSDLTLNDTAEDAGGHVEVC